MPTSRLEIDLGAIDRNIARLKAIAAPADPKQQVGFCAVIKQDGYGLGSARLAKRLAAAGVDLVAVYSLDEARALVDVPITTPVLVLMPVWSLDRADPLYRLAVSGRLHLTLHSPAQATELAAVAARTGVDFPVHVQVDTGLSRGGSLPDEATKMVEFASSAQRLRLAGLMTHFSAPSTDEPFTKEQARLFRSWIERIKPVLTNLASKPGQARPPVWVHAANTAATLRSASLHATMIRVGQGVLGYGAETLEGQTHVEFAEAALQLEACARWTSRIVHVQDVPAGWPVGYDRTWTAPRPSRVGLVPVGYANGYPRALSNAAMVRLTGQQYDQARTSAPGEAAPAPVRLGVQGVFAPVVGRVSMDQITLDLTGLPEDLTRPGCEVELVGADPAAPNYLPALARAAGTITHEMLCRVSASVERHYVTTQAPIERAPGDPEPPRPIQLPKPETTPAARRSAAVG